MEKFSSIEKDRDRKFDNPETAWKGNYISVVKLSNNYEAVREKDMAIVLPYLVERNSVILRYEVVPPYEAKYPTTEKFITIVSGGIEDGEDANATIRRELVEECGIKLDDSVNLEISKPLFVSKGNMATYSVCILPLMEHQYDIVRPTGDGSKNEALSNSIHVPVSSLSNIRCYDLITKYMLDKFLKDFTY